MATFPYLILISLLARGLTLEGYMTGIKFYIIPKWDRLLDVAVSAVFIYFRLQWKEGNVLF